MALGGGSVSRGDQLKGYLLIWQISRRLVESSRGAEDKGLYVQSQSPMASMQK